MPEKLWETIKEWRGKGVMISDEEANMIYTLCLRKMEIAKVENPDEYIYLLYPDEVKNHLIRDAINAQSYLMMLKKEIGEEQFNALCERR